MTSPKPTSRADEIAGAIISTTLRIVVATPALAFLWAILTAR